MEKGKLSARKLRAITLLAQGRSIEETARVIGVSKAAVQKWKKDPEFVQALNSAIKEIVTQEMLSGIRVEAELEDKIKRLEAKIEEILYELPPKGAIWPLLHYLRYLSDLASQRRNYVLEVWKKLEGEEEKTELERIRVIVENLTTNDRSRD